MKRVTSFFFLATLFCATFEKVHWTFAGNVSIADILAILRARRGSARRVPRRPA